MNNDGEHPAGAPRFHSPGGFTLAELVATIAIVGILSVFAVSRLTGSFASTRSFYDQLFAQLQYARKTAIAQRRVVCVHFVSASSVQLYRASAGSCAGTDGVGSPSGQTPFTVTAASGVSITAPASFPTVIRFGTLGEYLTDAGATPGGSLTVTVSGEGSYSFTIERITGYVHP